MCNGQLYGTDAKLFQAQILGGLWWQAITKVIVNELSGIWSAYHRGNILQKAFIV